MKRYLMIFLAAAAASVSCHKEPVQGPQTDQPQYEDAREVTIEAGILSRTVLADDNKVKWEGGDEIALVFHHSNGNHHVNKTFANQEKQESAERAVFKGLVPNSITEENGYNDLGFAVYPNTAIQNDGTFSHNLPAHQKALADESTGHASFESGLNLSSAAVALSEMGEGKSTKTDFRSALSVLKLNLTSDIESVTLTGTAPLAGTAPVQMYYNATKLDDPDNGRLLVVDGNWPSYSNSVTLTPADEAETFVDGTYNILVWPGKQEGLTITLNFKNLGAYEKASKISTDNPVTFKPAKYYTLNFTNTEELLVEELTDLFEGVGDVPNIDELEQTVQGLVNQVQSVSLLTEYLDNAAYARYAQMTYSKQKLDVSLDYIVKPESAAEALVEAYAIDSKVVSALLGYGKGAGLEIQSDPLAVKELILREIDGIGKVVTATVDASTLDNRFYEGEWSAAVALQITSGMTDIVSDFANLVPKAGSVIVGSYLSNIPVVSGARVVIPFSYAVSGDSATYTLAVTKSQGVADAGLNYYNNSKTGNLTVSFAEGAVQSPSVTLTLTVGEGDAPEVVEQEFTFIDNGSRINLTTNGDIDYIGGDAVVEVDSNLGSGSLVQTGGTSVKFDNIKVFTFDENAGAQRTANVEFSVMYNSLTYSKGITLTQKAVNTPLSRTYYAGSGNNIKALQHATNQNIRNKLNIVILGDGYKKKDLAAGGLFERRATSAMENFFGIEPFASYRDRFDVYMAGYESVDEGTDIKSDNLYLNTYFDSYWSGGTSTAISLEDSGKNKVIDAVQNDLGLTDGAYYRTVVIMLINTDANAGSTFYPEQNTGSLSGDGYHSFSVACVGANSTGFGGLIKHEAGGHAFGRLADEYITVAEGTTVSSVDKSTLENAHNVGFYTNVTTDYNNYSHWKMFTDAGYTSTEVGYYEGAWRGSYGVWRPSATSIMQSTGNTGNFNAVSRYAIWRRIILQAKGIENDTMVDFVSYDQKNR